MRRSRLDLLLVERGLFQTRAKAQAAVMAGQVLVDGRIAQKPGSPVSSDSALELVKPSPYVSRGGLKLEAALDHYQIDPKDRVCLDLGSSTGGFTDCLLQRGARRVYAVDVGRRQLDDRLRQNPRVLSFEETHARRLPELGLDPPPDLAVIDVSFISLTQVLAPVVQTLKRPFDIVALIKPQFEVGPKLAPKGVVRSAENRQIAVEKVRLALAGLGLQEQGLFESPVKGPKGNVEFFIWLRPGDRPSAAEAETRPN
ncbi:MAG: TlyA family RNA methyltransferase [Elusimicrobia bacterium]|nr:TlyA family RNA methyltransferase [Elusimicrobiota bacterium]